MNYKEAKAAVEAPKKAKEHYMTINLSYDVTLVLPYKDGVALLACLQNAEQMDDSYSSKKQIVPLSRDQLKSSMLSHQTYTQYKMAFLMGISPSDLERMEEEEMQQTNSQEPA